VDVNLIGWEGVGLGRTYGCRCGILYAPMLGVVFYAGLVRLTSSGYRTLPMGLRDFLDTPIIEQVLKAAVR